jgi:hypothetical protein
MLISRARIGAHRHNLQQSHGVLLQQELEQGKSLLAEQNNDGCS